MAEYREAFSNGVDRSNDELRLGEGFARVIEGAIYMPDDPDRIYKMPGRTLAATLSSPQSITPYGLRHIQFDTQPSQLLLLANAQLYRQTAATTLSSWTSVNDLQASPVAFPRSGTFLKTLPDGLNRWVSWTGGSERPLIHDEEGHVRFLSLNKPGTPTLATITPPGSPPAVIFPTSTAAASYPLTASMDINGAGAHVDGNRSGTGWFSTANAYDGNLTTFATGISYEQSSLVAETQNWSFSAGGTTNGHGLVVSMRVYGSHGYCVVGMKSGAGDFTRLTALYLGHAYFPPLDGQTIVDYIFPLTNGITINTIVVQISLQMQSATGEDAYACVHEIQIRDNLSPRDAAGIIPDGTYNYATTEVFRTTLSSGLSFEVESAPSTLAAVTLTSNTTVTAIQVTPAAAANITSDGIKHDPDNGLEHFRRVYRSTKTGAWPDLGMIGTLPLASTAFIDSFTTGATQLGVPSIFTVFAGTDTIIAAGLAPAFYDATVTRGGIIFAIPAGDRYRLQWCMPGRPDYWPLPAQDLSLLPSLRNDKLQGVAAIGDAILVFMRSRVVRLVDLPIVNQPNFDISRIQIDILSPNEGLAGSPLSYCLFQSQKGRGVCAWVSDNGIWMTDGTLLSERGMGISKLSVNMDWLNDVDTTRLDETELTYDPELQIIFFDYFDPSGDRRTYALHTHPDHWVDTGQDMAVPKVAGPTPIEVIDRTVAENDGGGFQHWSLSSSALRICNENTGSDNVGQDIVTHIESGWRYPSGAMEEFDLKFAGVYHNHWGINESCDLDILVRRDKTGIIQNIRKRIELTGARITRKFMSRAGQSCKIILRHVGKTGTGTRAFGPVVLDVTSMGELEND
jgi:hypothetical protein